MTTLIKASTSAGQSLILSVNNSAGSAGGNDVAVNYLTVDNTAELANYSANYNTATGVYTVPAGGHKNVKIKARNMASDALATNALAVVISGVIVKKIYPNGAYKYLEIEHDLKGLAAGATVQIKASCTGSNSAVGGTGDGLQIFATS